MGTYLSTRCKTLPPPPTELPPGAQTQRHRGTRPVRGRRFLLSLCFCRKAALCPPQSQKREQPQEAIFSYLRAWKWILNSRTLLSKEPLTATFGLSLWKLYV